ALFGNIAHGVVSALLFFVVGGLKDRWGGADLTVARDALRDVSPRMGFALVVGLASALGLPGLIGFWGEFLAVYAAWNPAAGLPTGLLRACAVAGVVGMTLAAGYALRVLRLVWSGHANWTGPAMGESVAGGRRGDVRGAEMAVLLALVVLVIGLGVVPNPLLGLTEPAADMLVTRSTPATTPPPGAGGTIVEAGR
ncbi:MAG: NADH-quinone oxidoreductase subunit M, partial [Actinomycetota bacterium]|nr:NADH-quinone oxidoreductase subunit M [Actinomycetota bacterium]